MSDKLDLDIDEIVLLKEVGVAHGGVRALYTDELILTNKKILCLHKGMFGGTKTTYIYPLEQIKIFAGEPQIKQGKLSNGINCLDVYMLDGEDHFCFQSRNNKTIEKWIAETRKIFGCEPQISNSSKPKLRTSRIEIEDDSVLGAFKEVGSEFKDVGKEFAAAFGIKVKDSDSSDNCDDIDLGDAVEFKYKIEPDEVLLLSNACVGINGDISNTADALLLTSKRIVIEYTTGFFNNQQHIDTFDLQDIKKYKDIPQIKSGKYDDEPALDIFFESAHLIFTFDEVGNKKKQTICVEKWVRKAIQAIDELKPKPQKAKRKCVKCGTELGENEAFCTNCGARAFVKSEEICEETKYQTCKKCGAKIEEGLKFCTECGCLVEIADIPTEHINQNQFEDFKPQSTDVEKEKLSIEQQIELLQKLKSLVDAGVLSQEEFEKKKKEIL